MFNSAEIAQRSPETQEGGKIETGEFLERYNEYIKAKKDFKDLFGAENLNLEDQSRFKEAGKIIESFERNQKSLFKNLDVPEVKLTTDSEKLSISIKIAQSEIFLLQDTANSIGDIFEGELSKLDSSEALKLIEEKEEGLNQILQDIRKVKGDVEKLNK